MYYKTEEWCKIWGGTNLRFEKWKECGKFWPKTWKYQNLHFIGIILTKVYNVWAKKIPEELCVMTLKGGAILKEKLTRN